MKYVLTIILVLGISTISISQNKLGFDGVSDWYQSGMHYKTVMVGISYRPQDPKSINTINVTLDSLQCLKLQKDLRNGLK